MIVAKKISAFCKKTATPGYAVGIVAVKKNLSLLFRILRWLTYNWTGKRSDKNERL